jgi:hypothetical protein
MIFFDLYDKWEACCGLFGAARAKYGIYFTSLGNDVDKNENLLYFLKDIGVINLICFYISFHLNFAGNFENFELVNLTN